jgi:hypothetical protein
VIGPDGVPDTTRNAEFGGISNERYQSKRFLYDANSGITGVSWSQSYGEGGNDFYLFSLSNAGISKKLATFGGSSDDVPTDIIRIPGGMAILGHSSSFSVNANKDIVLLRTDEAGNLVQ